MTADVLRFLEHYRDAFNALDGHAVAACYAVPSGIAQDRRYTHWPAFEPIRDNMVALCDLYRARGFVGAAFELAAFVRQGDDYAIADLRWRIVWSGDAEPWRFGTTYNLVRTDDGWRILLCTAHAEAGLHRAADAAS